MQRPIWYLGLSLFFAPAALAQLTLSEEAVRERRADLQTDIGNSNIGAGYAQMLNFFIEPSISASRLDTDDADYDIFKVPLQYELPAAEGEPQLLLRATFSHATAEQDLVLFEGERVDGEWTADSASVGVGMLWPQSERLSLMLGTEVGVSRLESDADYNGPLLEEVLAPIADGVLFNWDTNAWVAAATAGLDYHWRWLDRYDTSLKGRYTYSYISSYSESRDLPGFSESTGTASVKLDMRHPWAWTLWDRPLFGIVNVGATAFTGKNRDALGFTHFYEFGYSVGMKLAPDNRFLEDLSIGYQFSTGSDVDGYSILVGWTLK